MIGEPVRFVPEEVTARLITHEIAYDAVRSAFVSAASGSGQAFPAVIAHAPDPDHVFTIKSGSSQDYAGVKIGSYWPSNDALGIPRHSTTVILIDQATGHVAAAVQASRVNAFRTAAADAVATDALARPDSRILAIFGNGHQALYECLALARIRNLDEVLVAARNPARGAAFCSQLGQQELSAHLATPEEACAAADIIVTATNATAPLFQEEWVRPGTHISSMGSDARGKQELPPALLGHARLFCDLPSQSLVIGEFQHAAGLGEVRVTAIGEVLTGMSEGRTGPEDITVFDSSGIALQDLAVATALLALADS